MATPNEFKFTPGVRGRVPLLVGLVGGTGSGKTFSAMLLALGLAGGKKFAVIDTENGRATHYAPLPGAKADGVTTFDFDHLLLGEPFSPDRYVAAIHAAEKYPVVVVDSFSHEWAGDGGVLDMQESELQRMAGDDYRKRDACRMASWIKPKLSHKKMVSHLLQVVPHVIICLRAEPKVEMTKGSDGKMRVEDKKGPTGKDGWFPICDSRFPFELTMSLLLLADKPGVPNPIKLEAQHRALVSTSEVITAATGRHLLGWAEAGNSAKPDDEPELSPALRKAGDALNMEAWQISACLDEHDGDEAKALGYLRAKWREENGK